MVSSSVKEDNPRAKPNISLASAFLRALWPDPPDGYLLIWLLKGEKSLWFRADGPDAAATAAVEQADHTCVYFGCGLSPRNYGPKKRCKANDIIALPGLWGDVDVRGAAHKKEVLPPNLNAARQLIYEMPLPPSLLVLSGHGIQPWWLFKEAWVFADEGDRQYAGELIRRWQGHLHRLGELRGWDIDSTPDLARVLRLPGTLNRKLEDAIVPVAVDILEQHIRRYDPADLRDALPEESASRNGFGSAHRRSPEDWERVAADGVHEGDRHTTGVAYIGKLLRSLGALTDEAVGIMWGAVRLWNQSCRPPQDEKDLRRDFQDILAREQAQRGEAAQPEVWDEPLPLDQPPPPPAFPTCEFPAWWGDWIEATAHATQTPPDLAGMLSLATAGAALATRFAIEVRDGWVEPPNLFTVTALSVGERKSEVFRRVREPVAAHEKTAKMAAGPIIAAEQAEHDLLEARLKSLTVRAAKEDDDMERDRLRQQMRQAARELADHHVPVEPQLICDDVTVECLGKLLIEQGGRMLQAGPEGTAFEIVKGRYSDEANFDVYLKGHAGEALTTDRTGRGHGEQDAIHLSTSLAVQPHVIQGLAEEASLAKRGFLARFLYAMPPSKLGYREIAAAPVPESVQNAYRAHMAALWESQPAAASDGRPRANLLRFSPEADQLMRQFEQWLEPQLIPEGELSRLCGWANKLAGAIARIAGILHVAAGPRHPAPIIEAETVKSAIRLGRDHLLPHARIAFHGMGADERIGDAKRVFAWLTHSVNNVNGFRTFTRRDVHARLLGSRYTTDEVQSVLNLLVERGFIRPYQSERAGKRGRPVKHEYEAHPCIFKGENRSHCSQNREPGQEG
jgi:hypothetical protein